MGVVFVARRVDVRDGKATGDHSLVMAAVDMIAYKRATQQASYLLDDARRAISGDASDDSGNDGAGDTAMVIDARTKAANALNGKTPADVRREAAAVADSLGANKLPVSHWKTKVRCTFLPRYVRVYPRQFVLVLIFYNVLQFYNAN